MCNANIGAEIQDWFAEEGSALRNVKELITDLGGTRDVSEAAKRELAHIDDEDIVLLAQQSELCHKGCWADAAEVLKTIGYPRIKPVLPYLMEWFQDVNWPGVDTIVETLRSINPIELIPYIEEAAKRSIADHDDLWAFGFVTLIRDLGITHLVNKELYTQLVQLSDY